MRQTRSETSSHPVRSQQTEIHRPSLFRKLQTRFLLILAALIPIGSIGSIVKNQDLLNDAQRWIVTTASQQLFGDNPLGENGNPVLDSVIPDDGATELIKITQDQLRETLPEPLTPAMEIAQILASFPFSINDRAYTGDPKMLPTVTQAVVDLFSRVPLGEQNTFFPRYNADFVEPVSGIQLFVRSEMYDEKMKDSWNTVNLAFNSTFTLPHSSPAISRTFMQTLVEKFDLSEDALEVSTLPNGVVVLRLKTQQDTQEAIWKWFTEDLHGNITNLDVGGTHFDRITITAPESITATVPNLQYGFIDADSGKMKSVVATTTGEFLISAGDIFSFDVTLVIRTGNPEEEVKSLTSVFPIHVPQPTKGKLDAKLEVHAEKGASLNQWSIAQLLYSAQGYSVSKLTALPILDGLKPLIESIFEQ